MTNTSEPTDFSDRIAKHLPYLRRYARALTGSQDAGDTFALATLEAISKDRSTVTDSRSPKVGLFRAFHQIWGSAVTSAPDMDVGLLAKVQEHLGHLAKNTREVLLLHTVEEFAAADIAQIMDLSIPAVEVLLNEARANMRDAVSGRIMVIEDEPIIASDIAAIVEGLGHYVTGIARTHAEAVALGNADRPDLILADIQLADNSSGIEAVNELLQDLGHLPVIFITAFPERLLTGERPEPAFLISKPYRDEQVLSAVSQAMFFASTEILAE